MAIVSYDSKGRMLNCSRSLCYLILSIALSGQEIIFAWPNLNHNSASSSSASCLKKKHIFPFDDGIIAKLTPSCAFLNLNRDTDQDGILDWKKHPAYGGYWLPNDSDIDGDGVENFSDPHPFDPQKAKQENTYGPAMEHQWVRNIFKKHAILIHLESRTLSKNFQAALERSIEFFVGSGWGRLPIIKNIFFSDRLGSTKALGYYIEPIDSLVIGSAILDMPEIDIYKTLCHELGHKFLFAKIDPKVFTRQARSLAGWDLDFSGSYYAQPFFMRFYGRQNMAQAFPTSYAYRNSHEWFAENFTQLALNYAGFPNRIAPQIKKWIKSEFRSKIYAQ